MREFKLHFYTLTINDLLFNSAIPSDIWNEKEYF